MKNLYLYFIPFLLFTFNSYGQADVIIWIDNSSSISDQEYTDMSTSIKNIIENVLECNPVNKVAVVHYGGNNPIGLSKIWIESDFTNDLTLATSFVRRSSSIGNADFAHDALSLIGNALDHILNDRILSPQKTLDHSDSNNLILYLFTDAYRNNASSSYLVNYASPGVGTSAAFTNYTNFKNNRDAKFVVTLVPQQATAISAAAAIASSGGPYTGTVESYPNDPDGPGVTGRYLTEVSFDLTSIQLETISDFLCSLSNSCPKKLVLTSPTHDVSFGGDLRNKNKTITASNHISGTADANYFASDMIVFKPSFYSTNTAKLWAKLKTCEEMGYMRVGNFDEEEEISPGEIKAVGKPFTISPNPAKEKILISSSEDIMHVTVFSIEGRVVFENTYNENSSYFEIDIQDYRRGLYIVNFTTRTGKTYSEKLVVQ